MGVRFDRGVTLNDILKIFMPALKWIFTAVADSVNMQLFRDEHKHFLPNI